MRERPIIFSGHSVRGILDGRKTQTRRVVKLPRWIRAKQPDLAATLSFADRGGAGNPFALVNEGYLHVFCADDDSVQRVFSPYGVPGDRLWVRECFSYWHGHCSLDVGAPVHYWADGNPEDGDWTKPKPSIHMSRWASRLTLEITGVRVERLQDISEADARAEGCHDTDGSLLQELSGSAVGAYALLWNDINSKRAPWASNPWVWVINFTRAGDAERSVS